MRVERVRFAGALGHQLAGRLELPSGEPRATVLMAHCFTCSKDLRAAGWISRYLVAAGVASFRFDFAGIGDSEGAFEATNFSTNLEDLAAAGDYLRDQGLPPLVLLGHSLGGAAVLAAAGALPEARLVVTLAAPSTTTRFRAKLLDRLPALAAGEETDIVLGGQRFRITPQLLEDLAEHRLEESIAALDRELLVIHSPQDETVPFAEAERIFSLAQPPKSFLSLPGADHLLLNHEGDSRQVARWVNAWVDRQGEEQQPA